MIPGKTEVALIQVRQGEKADLRQLEEGQFGYALDTGELYIGAPNEGRLAGREFRNLKLLTELNGVSSATVTLVDVILQSGTNNGTMKLIRSYTNGEDVTIDNIPVRNVLTVDNIPDFVSVNEIFKRVSIPADYIDPTGEGERTLVPSLGSINLTLDNRLQYYIRNDKKTNDIILLGSTDGDKVTTPFAVDRTLTDRLQGYINKLAVPKVMVNVNDYTITTDNISVLFSLFDTQSSMSSSKILTLPSASTVSAGLITASDYATIQDYGTRISKLEASGVWKGSFENVSDLPISINDPRLAGGSADINDFVTVINGQNPLGDTGQAIFRLRNYDAATGQIPTESITISQTQGSSLSNLALDIATYKRRTGLDVDTDIVYTYRSDYNYIVTLYSGGEQYAVDDIVVYEGIELVVTGVDSNGAITSFTQATTVGWAEINETDVVLSDVSTTNRHDETAHDNYYEAARINITSTAGSNSSWTDTGDHLVDFNVLGISNTGTPVVGDEVTVFYRASGWGFDYWVSFNINIATEHEVGVVRGSPDINKITVGLDGTMTVNCYNDHEYRITTNTQAISERVTKAQGVANEGKILVVDNYGNLVLSQGRLNDGIWDYANNEFNTYPDNPIDDWDALPSGMYNLTTDSNTLHSVPGDTGGDFHVTTTTYKNKTIQIAIDMSNPLKQYTRSYDGTSWSSWSYPYASWVPGNN